MRKNLLMSAAIVALLLQSVTAWALPAFARRYNLECSMCHTSVAQLTRAGWEFREAGYRLPKEIGETPAVKAVAKDAAASDDADASSPLTNVSDYSDARITNSYTLDNKVKAGAGPANSGTLATGGGSLNLLCGSFDKYFGSFIEATLSTDNLTTTDLFNTGMVEAVYGNADLGWAHVRLGIFSNLYGFGGSDRGIGSSALFRSGMDAQAVSNGGKTILLGGPSFTGATAEGVELGYYLRKTGTELSLHWNDGSFWYNKASNGLVENGTSKLTGAIGSGSLTGNTDGGDLSFTLTQFIGHEDSLTFFGYSGNVAAMDYTNLPKGVALNPTNNMLVKDYYQRYAGWFNVWVVKDVVNVLGGGGYAMDAPDTQQVGSGANAIYYDANNSWGAFAEADWHPLERLGVGLRYDNVLPSGPANASAANGQQQYTLSVNWLAVDGLVVKPEFDHNESLAGLNGVTVDNKLATSVMYIW